MTKLIRFWTHSIVLVLSKTPSAITETSMKSSWVPIRLDVCAERRIIDTVLIDTGKTIGGVAPPSDYYYDPSRRPAWPTD
jgi:hypothetical protein